MKQHITAKTTDKKVNSDYVMCHICGNSYKSLSPHIYTHGISTKDYLERYKLHKKDLISDDLRYRLSENLKHKIKKGDWHDMSAMSKKGSKARDDYWNVYSNRRIKAIQQSVEMKRRLKDPKKLKHQQDLMRKANEKQQVLNHLSKKCPVCDKRYKASEVRSGLSRKRFISRLTCSQRCLNKLKKERGLNFSQFSKETIRIRKKVNKTVIDKKQ